MMTGVGASSRQWLGDFASAVWELIVKALIRTSLDPLFSGVNNW
jgi:hypothetical protein